MVFRSGRLVSAVYLHVIWCAWYSSTYSVGSRQLGHLSLKVQKQTVNDWPLQLPNQSIIKTKQQNFFPKLQATRRKCLACQISHTPALSKSARQRAEKGFAGVSLVKH